MPMDGEEERRPVGDSLAFDPLNEEHQAEDRPGGEEDRPDAAVLVK
jgi:hypothetical protein